MHLRVGPTEASPPDDLWTDVKYLRLWTLFGTSSLAARSFHTPGLSPPASVAPSASPGNLVGCFPLARFRRSPDCQLFSPPLSSTQLYTLFLERALSGSPW